MPSYSAGRIGIFGASGSGKSFYAKKVYGARNRVVFFDPMHDTWKGAKVASSIGQVQQLMAANFANFRITYRPKSGNEPRSLSLLSRLLEKAQEPYRHVQGPMLTLVVDEMSFSFPNAGGVKKCPSFAALCSAGRHLNIEIVGISQRITEVSTRFRGNTTETVIFAAGDDTDVRTSAGKAMVSVAEFKSLGEHEFFRVKGPRSERGKLKSK